MEFHQMQDCETGETNYARNIMTCNLKKIEYDEETGEPSDNELTKLRFHKTKFNIPKKYFKEVSKSSLPSLPSLLPSKSVNVTENTSSSLEQKSKRKCFLKDCKETYTLSNKNKVIHLKEEIILGYNKTSHRLFLIPSLIFFTQLTAVFITISEVLLHVWAHRKNLKNSNPYIYYRSPLHILTSQFCAICRSESDFEHINKLQQESRQLRNIKVMSRI